MQINDIIWAAKHNKVHWLIMFMAIGNRVIDIKRSVKKNIIHNIFLGVFFFSLCDAYLNKWH